MKLVPFVSGFLSQLTLAEEFGRNENLINETSSFTMENLRNFGHFSFAQFVENFDEIDAGLDESMEEQYRIFQRECFHFGNCKKTISTDSTRSSNIIHPTNEWDKARVKRCIRPLISSG